MTILSTRSGLTTAEALEPQRQNPAHRLMTAVLATLSTTRTQEKMRRRGRKKDSLEESRPLRSSLMKTDRHGKPRFPDKMVRRVRVRLMAMPFPRGPSACREVDLERSSSALHGVDGTAEVMSHVSTIRVEVELFPAHRAEGAETGGITGPRREDKDEGKQHEPLVRHAK